MNAHSKDTHCRECPTTVTVMVSFSALQYHTHVVARWVTHGFWQHWEFPPQAGLMSAVSQQSPKMSPPTAHLCTPPPCGQIHRLRADSLLMEICIRIQMTSLIFHIQTHKVTLFIHPHYIVSSRNFISQQRVQLHVGLALLELTGFFFHLLSPNSHPEGTVCRKFMNGLLIPHTSW